MAVRVDVESDGKKLHRLLIYIDGKYIGEYERAQESEIERKKAEIADAETNLLSLFQKHGELCVRWDGKSRKKSVRRAKDGVEVGIIPRSAWKTPSWQK